MKIFNTSLLVLGTFLAFGASAMRDDGIPSVVEVPAPIKGVFVPKGFDSNDNAQVVVTGAYPNSCYKVGPTNLRVDKKNNVVEIDVNAYYAAGSYCLMLYIPFTQTVNVGVLPPGDYKLVVNSKVGEVLPVALATSENPDDFVYATVESLARRSREVFQLQGFLPNSCADISEIRVLEEQGNVLTVLPIVSFAEGCKPSGDDRDLGFSEDFSVPAHLKGQKLIHVRSLNGASVNNVFDF